MSDAERDTEVDVWICDFADADDRAAFARLMAEFAAEPVSASQHLGVEHFERVADDLARRAGTLVLLAARAESEQTEGVLIAFEGYSSFARAQLFNIHDVHVAPAARGQGVGTAMLEVLADLGREHSFAKITLEVSASNAGAIRLYRKLGYSGLDGVALDAPAGVTYFANKKL
jgi:ribosomal protein S18 acetylase RimI-like enzyme